jgi:ribosomal protein S17E
MSKQTAVKWLVNVLISEPYLEEDFQHNKRCWEQALQMEREQIEEAFNVYGTYSEAAEYFNEIYGGNNE